MYPVLFFFFLKNYSNINDRRTAERRVVGTDKQGFKDIYTDRQRVEGYRQTDRKILDVTRRQIELKGTGRQTELKVTGRQN